MQVGYRVWEIIYLPQVGCLHLVVGLSWGSKKQTCISHSTMEAEFIALAATGKEAEWLRDLMMDIPFTANNVSTVSIHCDGQATLARMVKLKAFNKIQSMCDKHLKVCVLLPVSLQGITGSMLQATWDFNGAL
ncbi:hypothetical protein AAG906_019150 [Vitis piasezkii]